MKFLRLTKLCTLCDIAIFGTQDLHTLLESFPMSNHVDEHFQSFVSNMVCIGHCLKMLADKKKSTSTPLMVEDPTSFLMFISNNELHTNAFFSGINLEQFFRCKRMKRRTFEKELQQAISDKLAGSPKHWIGSSISVTSRSSRGFQIFLQAFQILLQAFQIVLPARKRLITFIIEENQQFQGPKSSSES